MSGPGKICMLTPAAFGIFSPLDMASTSSRVGCFGKSAKLSDAGNLAGETSFGPGRDGGCNEGADEGGLRMGAAGTLAPLPKTEFGRAVVGGAGASGAGCSSGVDGTRTGATGRVSPTTGCGGVKTGLSAAAGGVRIETAGAADGIAGVRIGGVAASVPDDF